MKPVLRLATLALAISISTSALADCGVGMDERNSILQAYPAAQTLERAGKMREALERYARAQAYLCGPNPNESAAAKRAAQIAFPLANTEEKKGNTADAQRLYELGAHYAAADRMMMTRVRANPDSLAVVEEGIKHFQERTLEAFAINNAARLAVTGPYTPDAKYVAEIADAAKRGAERALQREVTLFNEEYLRDFVQRVQSRPDDLTDMQGIANGNERERAFLQKWPEDLLKLSRAELELSHQFAMLTRDPVQEAGLTKRRVERLVQRANTLVQKFSGAPALLVAAWDYQFSASDGESETERNRRLVPIRELANRLGDEANAKQRLTLAADYYAAANERAKAQAARDRQNRLAQQKMQPDVDHLKRQAEALKASLGDPSRIQAMKAQAEAARKVLQAGQTDPQRVSPSADDLEAQLRR